MVIVRNLQLPLKVDLFNLVSLFGKLNFDKTRLIILNNITKSKCTSGIPKAGGIVTRGTFQ